jgi:integrase
MRPVATPKPKRKTLPAPSVFKYQGKWACDYFVFDKSGRRKRSRKFFSRELKRQDIEPTLEAQRKAAIAFREKMLKEKKEQTRLERREREQRILTLKELKEAKAAFTLFDQIPSPRKSMVEAMMVYREHLKLAVDSPLLRDAVAIFLGRKKEASSGKDGSPRLSPETYRTLQQHLSHLVGHFEQLGKADIKLGEVTAKQLIVYFEGLEGSERTRRNYVNDIANFFNDASDPKDKDRFINENPMDGVNVYFRKFNKGKAAKRAKGALKPPTILQFDRARHVLQTAFTMRGQGLLGFTVAGLFLGMRPSEVFDMVEVEDFWEKYIRLEEGLVRIDGFGKKRDQRTVLMSDNGKAWFTYIQEHALPFCFPRKKNGQNLQYANFRARAFLPDPETANRLIHLRRLHKTGKKPTDEDRAFMETCRVTLQEHEDVLRHTYGTNFYYANGCDKNKTIEQMGHSSEVFVEHYRGLLNSPKDAQAYFELYPDQFASQND